jgi:hypothetical protein
MLYLRSRVTPRKHAIFSSALIGSKWSGVLHELIQLLAQSFLQAVNATNLEPVAVLSIFRILLALWMSRRSWFIGRSRIKIIISRGNTKHTVLKSRHWRPPTVVCACIICLFRFFSRSSNIWWLAGFSRSDDKYGRSPRAESYFRWPRIRGDCARNSRSDSTAEEVAASRSVTRSSTSQTNSRPQLNCRWEFLWKV